MNACLYIEGRWRMYSELNECHYRHQMFIPECFTDNETLDVIKSYLPEIELLKNTTIGRTNVDLMADRLQCRTTECNLGQLCFCVTSLVGFGIGICLIITKQEYIV